ncbi:ribbon-helix-helix protein, CopG family [Lonepinella sp. BR2474]|uniref:ribbon-helix-helix protein, CopG family n=1 Tax=Lonepinella sp. BR2474 TaxID=3434548 RepID=UPI003F6DD292
MAMTLAEIQKRSEEKRGIKNKSFKLNIETISLIEMLSVKTGLPQNQLITKLVKEFAEKM